MVNYLFNHGEMHGEPFCGATGTSFVPISQDYIDERNEVENVIETYGYLWEEEVRDGNTTDSQETYIQNMIDAELNYGEGLFLGHDTSSVHHIPDVIKKMHFDGAESFECVGGGRMFPIKEEMLLILDQDLWDAVNTIEVGELTDLEVIQSLVGGELVGGA